MLSERRFSVGDFCPTVIKGRNPPLKTQFLLSCLCFILTEELLMRGINMSEKELLRCSVMENVVSGHLSLAEAASRLSLSYRQTLRLYKSYSSNGITALVHGLVGKPSNNSLPKLLTEKILTLIKNKYKDFGPTLASEELLENENITINPETLRLLMKKNNLLPKIRKHKPHRSRRQRYKRFGDLLQIDGSCHDWLENGKKCNLMNIIDDATGENLCLFSEAETTEAAVRIVWEWICKYGVPKAIYADRKSLYFSQNHPQSKSIFAQFCDRLNILLIPAASPQAKGRIERSNGTHQNRLIKKMTVRGIKNIDDANAYLNKYLQQHNSKFTVTPSSNENAHREKPNLSLNELCYSETERKIANDWTIRYNGNILQIVKQANCPPSKTFVTVRESLDKKITIFYRGYKVNYSCVDSHHLCDISTLLNCDISTLV
jgi:transposase